MKEKRKARLDKKSTGTTEFIGFGAFAGSNAATSIQSAQEPKQQQPPPKPKISPVFEGSNEALQSVFSRIGRKTDGGTKTKALQDLATLLLADGSDDSQRGSSSNSNNHNSICATTTKWEVRMQALPHWMWMYCNKLVYEHEHASIRKASLQVWQAALQRVPKAVLAMASDANGGELWGMIYTTQVDPLQEVRQEGFATVELMERLWREHKSSTTRDPPPWALGVITYSSRVLGYGRPSVMYEALFARKGGTSNKNQSEQQKEIAEERYGSLTGLVLDSLCFLFQSGRQNDSKDVISSAAPAVLFKCMSSPVEGLRQRTYRLISVVASEQSSPDMIDNLLPTTTINNLIQCLSSEKASNSWPPLLEAFLAVAVAKREGFEQATASWRKGLIKALRKACYGASLSEVGPILLPLTSTLALAGERGADLQLALDLIKAAWEGQHMTLGMTEAGRLAIAVAETAHYTLLKPIHPSTSTPHEPQTTDRQAAVAIAQIWLEVLENALTDNSLSTGNARQAAWEPLLQSLATQLQRYQDQTPTNLPDGNVETKRNHAFALIHNEFWLTKASWPSTHPAALAYFVRHLSSLRKSTGNQQICQVAQTCFGKLLAPYQETSGDWPSLAVYSAIQSLVDYHPTGVVTERFVLNDLLRWMIVHGTQQRIPNYKKRDESDDDEDLVKADYKLVALSLKGVPQHAKSWWQTILKEIIAAKPNLHMLTVGLDTLLQTVRKESNWVSCQTLDELAMDLFAVQKNGIQTFSSAQEQLEFCRTLLGLKRPTGSQPIVSEVVWEFWVKTYKKQRSANSPISPKRALAQILLEMTKVPRASKLLHPSDVEDIIVESWLQEEVVSYHGDDAHHEGGIDDDGGGDPRHHFAEVLQTSSPDLVARVVGKASAEMKRSVQARDVVNMADWGLRAWRLVEMLKYVDPPETPSLALVGLDDDKGWSDHPDFFYGLAMSLFHNLDEKSRFGLLKESQDTIELFLSILGGITISSTDLTIAARVSRGDDKPSIFLNSLGSSLKGEYLHLAVKALIPKIAASASERDDMGTCCLTTVLSNLLRFTFDPVTLPVDAKPVPSDIRSGDRLWYVTDPKNPTLVEPATVVKVYYDAVAGYYFSISVSREGEPCERQTIVDRLRITNKFSPTPAQMTDEVERAPIRDLVVSKVLVPFFQSTSSAAGVSELVNGLVSRVGVGSARGIGSAHFVLFKLLSEEEGRLRVRLAEGDYAGAGDSLWKLALSFGFGRNSESEDKIYRVFPVDPTPSHEALVKLYAEEQFSPDRDHAFGSAVLAWIAVSAPFASPTEANEDLMRRSMTLALSLSNGVFSVQRKSGIGFSSDTILALRAFNSARRTMVKCNTMREMPPSLRDKEVECLRSMIEAFTLKWSSCDDEPQKSPVWKAYSEFPRLIEDIGQTAEGRELLAESVPPAVVEHLVPLLFSVPSRFIAFNLLGSVFACGKVLRSENDIALGASTTELLKEWTKGMDQDATNELAEDVETVGQWLPLSIMHEIETWRYETFDDLNETKMIGRLLTWLSVLKLVETAAPKDYRSRPAFVAYLTRTQAVSSILNFSILFDKNLNEPSKLTHTSQALDLDMVLSSEETVDVTSLASLVIFGTFETLPSLCRQWYEEAAPKVYVQKVKTLVERQIAPEILKREMQRMKEATKNFGEMNVSGSLMSREVTASYIQDDFTLTVLVRLPPAFPLRSAEVDCSRTLGVPLSRWKRWSLQITLMLNNQGGTLQDALMLWKDNVDKEFDGVEPCPICYSVLHVKTHKLPPWNVPHATIDSIRSVSLSGSSPPGKASALYANKNGVGSG
eukprot:CAMPEP_0168804738 /NCGR_PEP_ID=MMETSP0726-20121227/669_1 /TAXON_ID=265536 /ORGANISM="Amphiprora sp., Strain CCMP467" /LENGTH=1807 /DNA_ID=CAMNT_0008856589 /DNA_START=103 /DNA_END=5527 /DNA_ORIENTATION=+